MITILMATYNGATYLPAQIDSLLEQTAPFDTLHIQDDCSTDGTWAILEHYQSQYPDRIAITRNEKNTGSPKHNFYSLMSRVRDDYIMLCDQDDVWMPEKMEKTLAKMREMEKQYGKSTPLLVHTDLCVVDENLRVINPSFKAAMNVNYNRTKLNQTIIQNTLTGCTAMYNRALASLIGETPPQYMAMHDWWLILIASAFGHIGHINEATMLYRQHGSNEIGAKDVRTFHYKLKKLLNHQEIKESLAGTYRQAESFLTYHRNKLDTEQTHLLTEYIKIPQMGKLERWRAVRKLGTYKNGVARNIAYFLFI